MAERQEMDRQKTQTDNWAGETPVLKEYSRHRPSSRTAGTCTTNQSVWVLLPGDNVNVHYINSSAGTIMTLRRKKQKSKWSADSQPKQQKKKKLKTLF